MITESYWLSDATPPADTAESLPARVDVLIVGAGYTGLSAARETARAGLSTLVLDAGAIGGGCSGRNGGQVAYSIKPALADLTRRHGAGLASRIRMEGENALVNLRALAAERGLDFDWRVNGGFHAAHTQRHYRALAREAEAAAATGAPVRLVGRSDLEEELYTDRYYGGCVYAEDASVHPLRLVRVLHERAAQEGAAVMGQCAVQSLNRTGEGFHVRTARGTVVARRVLLATNGYTGPLSPWHRRRVIPIGSYQIATEDLGEARVRRLIPHARNVSDTRRVIIYLRPSPDGRRILFGGRAALGERDPTRCVTRLLGMLRGVFPSLTDVAATHAWVGIIAYTFDTLPHLGQRDGLYFSLGYCGQGVPLATYFGMRIGQQIAGRREGATALDGIAFPTRPLYAGNPWFLAPSILAYRALDSLGV